MSSFLTRIARTYYENYFDRLSFTTFVFPNKRSCLFFKDALRRISGERLYLEPDTVTISEFVENLTDLVVGSRFEQLATLFAEYRKLSPDAEFDNFVFWGDMLLRDFNDVDMYMADAKELFANLNNLRSIATDYLTDEQRAVIEEYWNVSLPMADPDSFWKHVRREDEEFASAKFYKLWEILYPLYVNFNKSLSSRGLTYSGHQIRCAVDGVKNVSESDDGKLPQRVVMVGFNMLSIAETKLFEALRDTGHADFYWETDFPTALVGEHNVALSYLKRYCEKFPSLYDVKMNTSEMPDIDVVSVPSAVGQTKFVSELLETMSSGINPLIPNADNAINTAIVLPSETLFLDLLHSIPPKFSKGINVTMGLPLRMSSLSVLMGAINCMQQRASVIRDEWHFFYEDVSNVLSSPLINRVMADGCNALRSEIETNRLYTVPVSLINEVCPELTPVFSAVAELQCVDSVFGYTVRLIDFLSDNIAKTDDSDNDNINIEQGVLLRYRQAVQMLWTAIQSHGITMNEGTFFTLIERAVAGETAAFKGEPLCGLQIMGVLETRTLNFDNVIMLSMNDRIYPRRHRTNSFIPETLRRAYGVSTPEMHEAMSSYYFYRLIAGAKHVTLIYDSRVESGDPSRYIHQLLYNMPPGKIRQHNYAYTLAPLPSLKPYSVAKTAGILAKINRFKSDSDDRKTLSPSSIKTYLSCPLNFYFEKVQGLSVADEIVDFIDDSDYGTITHFAAESIYKDLRGSNSEAYIDNEVLNSVLSSVTVIPQAVTNAINCNWHHLPNLHPDAPDRSWFKYPYQNYAELTGEALIIHGLIVKTLRRMFEAEMTMTPYYFVDGEYQINCRLKLNEQLSVNLRGTIDRIDRLPDGSLRFIDYKTGNDKVDAKAVESIVDDHDYKAILQLFIYANAYSQSQHFSGRIVPVIYNFKDLWRNSNFSPITIAKSTVDDYRDYSDAVMSILGASLGTLFDPDKAIMPSPGAENCRYCKFKSLCGLGVENKW